MILSCTFFKLYLLGRHEQTSDDKQPMLQANPGNNKHVDNEIIKYVFVCLMVFNATFNNISVASWRSVLLVDETRVPGENHRPVARH